jgi:hypothetical protein
MKNIGKKDEMIDYSAVKKNIINPDYHKLISEYKSDIQTYSKRIRLLVENMNGSLLNISFDNDGVTLGQFIHSCADYVINKYVQLKLILTETEPAVPSYQKDRWALLPGNKIIPVDVALNLIENIHRKLIVTLKSLKHEDLNRKYFDPVMNKTLTLKGFLEQYSNKCNQHIIKITQIKVLLENQKL